MGSLSRVERFFDPILPFILVLQSFLGALQLLDSLDFNYRVLVDRSMTLMSFELGVNLVVPLLLLFGLWVSWAFFYEKRILVVAFLIPLVFSGFLSMTMAVSLSSLVLVMIGLMLSRRFMEYLRSAFTVFGAFFSIALIHWAFFIPLGLNSPLVSLAFFELKLSYFMNLVSPYLVLMMILMFLVRPFLGGVSLGGSFESEFDVKPRILGVPIIYLVLALSGVAAVYPLLPTLNPDLRAMGADVFEYVEAAELVSGDVTRVFSVMGGSRPVVFLLTYLIQRFTGVPSYGSVLLLPVVLSPFLALSAYLLSLEIFDDMDVAGVAAFFTVCGHQAIAGYYGFLLANIVGLILVFLSLRFLFRAMRLGSRRELALAVLFGALLVFSHPWTFDQYVVPVLALLIILVFNNFRVGLHGKEISYLIAFLLGVCFFDLVKVYLLGGTGAVPALDSVASGLTTMRLFWYHLSYTFTYLFGGFLSNLLVIVLVVVGVFFWRRKGPLNVYLILLVFFSSLVFLIGDEVIKSRIFFNFPLGLLASFGFVVLSRGFDERTNRSFMFFLSSGMMLNLFRSLANLI